MESRVNVFPRTGVTLWSGSKAFENESPKSFSPEKALKTIKSEAVATTITIKAMALIRLIIVCRLLEKK